MKVCLSLLLRFLHSAACWCVLRPASVGGSIATDTRKSSLSVGSNPSYCGGSSTFPWAVRDSIPAWKPASVPVRRVHSSAVEHWIADPMVTGSIPVVPFLPLDYTVTGLWSWDRAPAACRLGSSPSGVDWDRAPAV